MVFSSEVFSLARVSLLKTATFRKQIYKWHGNICPRGFL